MKRNINLTLIILGVLVLVACENNQNHGNNVAENQMTRMPTLVVGTPSSMAAGATQTQTQKPTQYYPTTPPSSTASGATQTQTQKPTQHYTTTPPSATPVINFENPVLIFKGFSPSFYIVDMMNGDGRLLRTKGEIIGDILTWNEACKIIARVESGIAEINLDGKVIRSIFSEDQLPDSPEGLKWFLKPSPDEQWISYRLGLGEYYDGFDSERTRHEFEYLLIQSIDGSQGPYQVSSGGSTVIWAWSPDSQRVAYADVDETGIHQVYAVNPDGSQRHKLTNFDADFPIEGLEWSPDNHHLAVEYLLRDGYPERNIRVVSDEENPQMDLYRGLWLLWWKDVDTLLAYEPQGYFDGVIKQLDVGSHRIVGSAHVNTDRRYIVPLGSQRKVGFLNFDENFDDHLSVYDTERHTITDFPNISFYSQPEIYDYLGGLLDYMIASPDSFSGESECPNW
jgi:hypothetical protein